jgi:hypothetical protein
VQTNFQLSPSIVAGNYNVSVQDSGSSSNSLSFAVTPVITNISPAQGLVGAGQNVVINGAGFASGATINAGPNISVSNVSVASSAQMTATFTPTNSASAGGNQNVIVKVNGQTSNSGGFYIQVPTHFQRFDLPPHFPNGLGPVVTITDGNVVDGNGIVQSTHMCGVYENFAFDVADQANVRITNGTVTIQEVFSNISNGSGPKPSTNIIDLSHVVEGDLQFWGYAAPTCPATNDNQTLDMSWTVQVGSTSYPIETIVHISKGNFNGALNLTSTITTP